MGKNGSFLGQKTKITVVRKLKLDDVAREYGQIRPGTESGDFIPALTVRFSRRARNLSSPPAAFRTASRQASATGPGLTSGRTS